MISKIWEKVKPSHVRIPLMCSISNARLLNMLQPVNETVFNVLLWSRGEQALVVFREGHFYLFLGLLSCLARKGGSFASFERDCGNPSSVTALRDGAITVYASCHKGCPFFSFVQLTINQTFLIVQKNGLLSSSGTRGSSGMSEPLD